MISRTNRVTSLVLLLLLPLVTGAQALKGRVVRIIDGDTLVLVDASDTQHMIRLARIDLPPLSPSEASRVAEQHADPERFLVGFGRAIPGLAEPDALAARSSWQATPDGGKVAAVSLTSPGAVGVRLGLRVLQLPDAAVLRFFAPGAERVHALAGASVNASVAANRGAGVDGAAAETYWSPRVDGDTLALVIELPPGVDPRQVRIALPRLSHFFRPLFEDPESNASETAGCHQDPACHPGWDDPSRATAMLLHTDDAGDSGVCTGTLLRDGDPSTDVPYLLTAHHCVPGQTRASSLETYWLLRPSRCDGPRENVQSVSGGAELLYTEQTTDTSFLRLRHPPPPGVVFSAWSAALPALGTAITGLHHPRGGSQQIAFGTLAEYLNCEDVAYCGEQADPDELHYLRVRWSIGATSPGSSGSGLFLDTGQLVGVLSGGFSRCDNPGGDDDYGRFDLAYRQALHRWLGPASTVTEPSHAYGTR